MGVRVVVVHRASTSRVRSPARYRSAKGRVGQPVAVAAECGAVDRTGVPNSTLPGRWILTLILIRSVVAATWMAMVVVVLVVHIK